MDNFLVISNAILWLAVIVLSLMVYALIRQVGILYERVAPAGALAINKSITVGEQSPKLSVKNEVTAAPLAIGASGSAKSQLLFFASPSCPVCKTLMPIAKSAAKAERSWLDLIVATDAENNELHNYIQAQELGGTTVVNSELLGKTFGVSKLPYAVLIDEQGVVRGMGIVNSREHLESLFNAKELGYASLQEYMQKHYA
ncbi:thioredoxin-like domain-containing protein [Halioxenophilus aromaticivorans]|uniref:Thioredoxin domain-containing protein n=1 Tax=Halioxenophilus aromaticivorans TaxID=1306992 RepID=A0AAV3U6D0_9ALTE